MIRIVDFRCEDFLRRVLAESVHSGTLVQPQPSEARTPEMDRAAASCRVLVVAEVRDGRLDMATARSVSCGRRVCGDVEIALFATHGEMLAAVAGRLEGVTRVLQRDAAASPERLADDATELIRTHGSTHVFAPGSAFGKQLIVRLAERFGVTPVFSVMGVVTPTTFTRARGRATMATIETTARPVLATVRLGAFHATGLPRQRRARGRQP